MVGKLLEKYSALENTCEALFSIDPLQKKAILQHLDTLSPIELSQVEELLSLVIGFLKSVYHVSLLDCAKAYSAMCREMLHEQIKFSRTGKYSASCAKEVKSILYDSEQEMSKYVYGLALSIFLWPNHLKMYDFFIEELSKLTEIGNYLEIGPGHGLFLLQAMRRWRSAKFNAVDISAASAKISELFVGYCFPDRRTEFHVQDFNEFNKGKYDFITIGEVLEHLDDPMWALEKLRALLKSTGHCFVSTCANCPAVDHIYLFNDAQDIRNHIERAGLEVVRDLSLEVKNIASVGKFAHKKGINYAALVRIAR